MFESSVNLYGSKTYSYVYPLLLRFESSVNLYGSKTKNVGFFIFAEFESSVNLYGSKTELAEKARTDGLRVM